MRIAKALAFLGPLSIVIACSSGGEGTVSIPGPPGGFGQEGSPTPVLAPGTATGGATSGQDSGTTNPGRDTGSPIRDTGSGGIDTGPKLVDNYDACIAAVNKVNALPCAVDSPYPASSCSHAMVACDLTAYYGCVGEGFTCNESGGLDGTAAGSCKNTCGG